MPQALIMTREAANPYIFSGLFKTNCTMQRMVILNMEHPVKKYITEVNKSGAIYDIAGFS